MKKGWMLCLSLGFGLLVPACQFAPTGPKPTPPTATSTPIPLSATPTVTATTLTATFTPTPTASPVTATSTWTPSVTPTRTATATPTGCDKTCFATSAFPTVVSGGAGVTVLSFTGSSGCGSSSCFGNSYAYQVASMSFSLALTGNLSSQITAVQLWDNGTLVASGPWTGTTFTLDFSPLGGRNGTFNLVLTTTGSAVGSAQTSLTGVTFSGYGYALSLPLVGPAVTIGPGATYTPTPTSTLYATTATWTPTPVLTDTPTPSTTVDPTACGPVTLAVTAGISIMSYGQSQFYDIRTQADWDAYRGVTGTTPPVDLSTQRLLVENWGTEYCSPGNGRVVERLITSVCVLADRIQVTIGNSSSCTCGGSCVYTMAANQVSAAVVPASSLPVSIQ